jgi:hypothetical protein
MVWRGVLCVGVVMLVTELSAASAAENEVRSFHIQVDGKKAGHYVMTITKKEDGNTVMTGRANVRISFLVKTYTYTYDGTEIWKDGRLTSLQSSSNDNGKRYEVRAVADGNGLRMRVNNGPERLTRADVCTTSYWQLPEGKNGTQALPALDADTGQEINGQVQSLGTTRLFVGGHMQECTHVRVTGGPFPVDLWYDAQKRLVRQDFVEQGHRTVLELVSIQK